MKKEIETAVLPVKIRITAHISGRFMVFLSSSPNIMSNVSPVKAKAIPDIRSLTAPPK